MNRVVPVSLVFLLALWTAAATAEESNQALFERGVTSLEKGDYASAITVYETLADRGFVHPDVSYNRGMAYLARVRAKQHRPGDLGRAAAGFEEALSLRPGDEEARVAVELVRAEVARRGAAGGGLEMEVRPSLDRMIVGLAPEGLWAWLALLSSVTFAAGLVLRRARAGAAHISGVLATPLGLAGLLLFAGLAGWARHVRVTHHPGVVVAPEARVLDEEGTALPAENPIPEAARVDILDRRGALVKVRHGQREGWTHAGGLRELAVR